MSEQPLFGPAEAGTLLKLGATIGAIGLAALAKTVVSWSDSWTFGLGLTIGCSVTAIVLAALLLLSARNVMRHRAADNGYWRALQAKRRPQFIVISRVILAVAALTAVVAGSMGSPFTLGVATIPGLLGGIAVVAETTGAIRPY